MYKIPFSSRSSLENAIPPCQMPYFMSNFKTMQPSIPYFLFFIECKVAKVAKMLLTINLSNIKDDRFSETTGGSFFFLFSFFFFNLLATVFDKIFYKTLHKLIRWYSVIFVFLGAFVLGIRTKWVWLTRFKDVPFFKHSSIVSVTLPPIDDKNIATPL